MRILALTIPFFPSLGGIETVAGLLAREWSRQGHEVTVVTMTAADEEQADLGYTVRRRPSLWQLIGLIRRADLVSVQGPTLRLAWPLLLFGRVRLLTHQALYGHGGLAFLRRLLLGRTRQIAISTAVARSLPVPSILLGNPYDERVFAVAAGETRNMELAFVGRLVPEKGLAVLIKALAILAGAGCHPELSVIGDGPARPDCEKLASESGVEGQIRWLGVMRGEALCRALNQHRILVVPSAWDEPFGIVALEGIACGCVVVGTAGGGLPEAIGPCGVCVPRNDPAALAAAIQELLGDPERRQLLRAGAEAHLASFRSARIASAYLALAESRGQNATG